MISKSRSSSIDIRQTREMNLACFFCIHQFLLLQWNTDCEVPNTAVMHLWNLTIYSVMQSCEIVGQMLTSEVLTIQGRNPFHDLQKERVKIQAELVRKTFSFSLKMMSASLTFIRQNSLPDQTAFFINKDRLLSWKSESTMCNYFTWKWRDFSAFLRLHGQLS